MAKTRAQKEQLLEQYKQILSDSKGYFAVTIDKLDNVTATSLKMDLQQHDSRFIVLKNRIFRIALQDTDLPVEAQTFDGATAIVTYQDDPSVVAKMIKELKKEKFPEESTLTMEYGIVDKKYLDTERANQIADLPPREVLLAQMLGSMTAPITGAMNALTGNVRGFVQVLKQLSEQTEEAAQAG